MDIKTASIFVADQGKALTFYTDILGFRKINDIDLGEFRWLTVSSDGSGETELLLEPNVHQQPRRSRQPSMPMAYRLLYFTVMTFTTNLDACLRRASHSGSFLQKTAESGWPPSMMAVETGYS